MNEIIGYDEKKINALEKLNEDDFEPVKANTFLQCVICVVSMVAENKTFQDIKEELDCTEIYLKQLFINTPSLPRPYDIHKYI